jgi:hypothetical protein
MYYKHKETGELLIEMTIGYNVSYIDIIGPYRTIGKLRKRKIDNITDKYYKFNGNIKFKITNSNKSNIIISNYNINDSKYVFFYNKEDDFCFFLHRMGNDEFSKPSRHYYLDQYFPEKVCEFIIK